MVKDLNWLVYEGVTEEQKLIVREIARDNNYPIFKHNNKYYRVTNMKEVDSKLIVKK